MPFINQFPEKRKRKLDALWFALSALALGSSLALATCDALLLASAEVAQPALPYQLANFLGFAYQVPCCSHVFNSKLVSVLRVRRSVVNTYYLLSLPMPVARIHLTLYSPQMWNMVETTSRAAAQRWQEGGDIRAFWLARWKCVKLWTS